jgi:hypothetical protein
MKASSRYRYHRPRGVVLLLYARLFRILWNPLLCSSWLGSTLLLCSVLFRASNMSCNLKVVKENKPLFSVFGDKSRAPYGGALQKDF